MGRFFDTIFGATRKGRKDDPRTNASSLSDGSPRVKRASDSKFPASTGGGRIYHIPLIRREPISNHLPHHPKESYLNPPEFSQNNISDKRVVVELDPASIRLMPGFVYLASDKKDGYFVTHSGAYTIPAGQGTTVFGFVPVVYKIEQYLDGKREKPEKSLPEEPSRIERVK